MRVIGEMEVGGEMEGGVGGYGEVGCRGGGYEVWGMWGIWEKVVCGGKEERMGLMKDVVGEMMEMLGWE